MKHLIKKTRILSFLCLIGYATPAFIYANNDNDLHHEYVALANSFTQEGNNEKAILYYKKALAMDQTSFQAAFNIATIYYAQDKINPALEYFQKTISIKKDCAPAHFNIGICHT